jgi:hypothetical protein
MTYKKQVAVSNKKAGPNDPASIGLLRGKELIFLEKLLTPKSYQAD